jgi:hypothetical protein
VPIAGSTLYDFVQSPTRVALDSFGDTTDRDPSRFASLIRTQPDRDVDAITKPGQRLEVFTIDRAPKRSRARTITSCSGTKSVCSPLLHHNSLTPDLVVPRMPAPHQSALYSPGDKHRLGVASIQPANC